MAAYRQLRSAAYSSMNFAAVCAPVTEGIQVPRKVLVVSTEKERLSAAVAHILDKGVGCMVAKSVDEAMAKINDPRTGFVVIDGDCMLEHVDVLLSAIARLRPDISRRQKLHIFSSLEDPSDVEAYFRTHARGIKPLTWQGPVR